MRTIVRVGEVGFIILVAVLISFSSVDAKFEFFKQEKANHPDLKCVSCHVSVPKKGDEDKKLNETGRFYQENKSFPTKK